MKKTIILSIFFFLAFAIGVYGAACTSTPVSDCTIATSLTLQGDKDFYFSENSGQGIFRMTGNNLFLDCNNSRLHINESGQGLYAYLRSNITIKNCNFIGLNDIDNYLGASGNWTDQGGNIWSSTRAISDPKRLVLDGSEYDGMAQDETKINSSQRWYHDGTNLFVYATSNPSTFYTTMERPAFTRAIAIYNSQNVTLEYNNITGAGLNAIYFRDVNRSTVEYNDIGAYSARGMYSYGQATNASGYNVVRYNRFNSMHNFQNTWNTDIDDAFKGDEGTSDWEIYGNNFTNWGHDAIYILSDTVNSKPESSRNKVYNNSIICNSVTYGRGFNIDGLLGTAQYNYIYDNTVTGCPISNQINGNNNFIENNTIIGSGVKSARYPTTATGYGIDIQDYCAGCSATNITIRGNSISNFAEACINIGYNATGVIVQENTMFSCSQDSAQGRWAAISFLGTTPYVYFDTEFIDNIYSDGYARYLLVNPQYNFTVNETSSN